MGNMFTIIDDKNYLIKFQEDLDESQFCVLTELVDDFYELLSIEWADDNIIFEQEYIEVFLPIDYDLLISMVREDGHQEVIEVIDRDVVQSSIRKEKIKNALLT